MQRPLFLAAPGVANAQSAYFSFSQFLHWSDQPIYVLDKDNDLNIAQLARQNASDIVKVQPQGPYLLGGHSYGGAVAMEVAMVLESWGHEVGAVLVRTQTLAAGVMCMCGSCLIGCQSRAHEASWLGPNSCVLGVPMCVCSISQQDHQFVGTIDVQNLRNLDLVFSMYGVVCR